MVGTYEPHQGDTMSVTPLTLPAKMSELAKGLGAVFDEDQWVIPSGTDPFPFYRWLRGGKNVNLRATEYWIAQTLLDCPHCDVTTDVIGFVLPTGFEFLEPGESGGQAQWVRQPFGTFISHIEYLLPSVFDNVFPLYHWFQARVIPALSVVRYLNFCKYCHQEIDDNDLVAEPGQGFMPMEPGESHRIHLKPVKAPFMAAASEWTEDLPWLS